jgi:hypothetical protein
MGHSGPGRDLRDQLAMAEGFAGQIQEQIDCCRS